MAPHTIVILLGVFMSFGAVTAAAHTTAAAVARARTRGGTAGGGACGDIVDCQANGECVPSVDLTCGVQPENWPAQPTVTLECAHGTLTVTFASYGMPVGACGGTPFAINASCHASDSLSVVSALCNNQTSCEAPAYAAAFRDDPCPNEAKSLAVNATCSPAAHEVVTEIQRLHASGTALRPGDIPLPLRASSSKLVGTCVCDPGWRGPNCEYLDVPAVLPTAAGYRRPNVSSWGMHPVYYPPDGLWHTWVDENMGGCGIYSWISNSRVVHAVSLGGPVGPYEFVEEALGNIGTIGNAFSPTNPHAVVDPQGGLLLWSINASIFLQQSWINATAPGGSVSCVCTNGNGTTTPQDIACSGCWPTSYLDAVQPQTPRNPSRTPLTPVYTTDASGLCTTAGWFYTANTSASPWTPITWPPDTNGDCNNNAPPGVPPTGNNPSPFIFPNGTFVMTVCCSQYLWPVYKASAWNQPAAMIANLSNTQYLNMSADRGGDPVIYGDKRGNLHVLSSWGWQGLNGSYTMVHTFSVDGGVTWRDTNVPPLFNVLVYDDGEVYYPKSVERPKVILDDELNLAYLVLAVDPNGKYWCNYDISWSAMLPLSVNSSTAA